MTEAYLWDRSGDPDPEVQRLERVLAPLGHQRRRLDLDRRPEPPRPRARGWVPALAAAALIVLGLGAWLATRRQGAVPAAPVQGDGGWNVTRLSGAPRVGARAVEGTRPWSLGEWLETDGASRARVLIGALGHVDVAPNTRLRLAGTGPRERRLTLARGAIGADVSAPPRLFLVETPTALAVDLGCSYTLEVDASGAGVLRVTRGFVSLEGRATRSYVPAGALCRMRPGRGPGTPFFADAPPAVQAAVDAFDSEGDTEASLARVLAAARPEETLTLWHLFTRVDAHRRGAVYDALARLAPPPAGVTREGMARLDPMMLDRWRSALERTWPLAAGQAKSFKKIGGRR